MLDLFQDIRITLLGERPYHVSVDTDTVWYLGDNTRSLDEVHDMRHDNLRTVPVK